MSEASVYCVVKKYSGIKNHNATSVGLKPELKSYRASPAFASWLAPTQIQKSTNPQTHKSQAWRGT
ncbi:hypothetical protein PTD2_14967 [Pseudoalteromonas tunicata D2]|uniref:Uncharacterized protein n=1 Tax=Pseudoalteromonas tunicata D2 TaxID=87626 RepID=A4CCQ8_9GAMM|nr:hypothetical protein PTD2_14967 [Pseudoalteromonas tunicata D2]